MPTRRVLLGNHPNYGYGLYISRPGVDVQGANKDDFLFDSKNGAGQGQLAIFKKETLTAGQFVERSFYSFGNNCHGFATFRDDGPGGYTRGWTSWDLTDPTSDVLPFSLKFEEVDSDTCKYRLQNLTAFTQYLYVVAWRSE